MIQIGNTNYIVKFSYPLNSIVNKIKILLYYLNQSYWYLLRQGATIVLTSK